MKNQRTKLANIVGLLLLCLASATSASAQTKSAHIAIDNGLNVSNLPAGQTLVYRGETEGGEYFVITADDGHNLKVYMGKDRLQAIKIVWSERPSGGDTEIKIKAGLFVFPFFTSGEKPTFKGKPLKQFKPGGRR